MSVNRQPGKPLRLSRMIGPPASDEMMPAWLMGSTSSSMCSSFWPSPSRKVLRSCMRHSCHRYLGGLHARCVGLTAIRVTVPAPEELVLKVELGKHLAERLRQQILDRSRTGVEGGHRGQYRRPGQSHRLHIPDVDEVQGRFAGDEHQRASLLQADVCGPRYQGSADAGGHLTERVHGTRNDRHADGDEGARGDARAHVVGLVHYVRELLEGLRPHVQLSADALAGALRNDQVYFYVIALMQDLQHSQAQLRRTRSSHPDDDPGRTQSLAPSY